MQQQVRADIHRAAGGDFVRHELEVQGEEGRAIIDFSIRRFLDESGNKRWLLPEGRDITQLTDIQSVSPKVPIELPNDDLLISSSQDRDQAMSDALIDAFLALDIDIFETESQLEDWINTDAVDAMAWTSERPLLLVTRIWGYNVVVTGDEVRIYTDS